MAKRKTTSLAPNKTKEMNMYISQSFDTHKFVKSFTLTGMKEAQAEAIVSAIVQSRDHDFSKIATKEQLEAVKVQIADLKDELRLFSTKDQVESIKEELKLFSTKDQVESIKEELKLFSTKDQVESVKAQVESVKEELKLYATKEQLESVKEQVNDLKEELKLYATKEQLETVRIQLDAKIDNRFAQLDAKIAQVESTLLKWYVGTNIATIGIIIGALKFLR